MDEALLIADRIIEAYPDGRIRDGTVVAQKHEPASAIVVTGNRDQNIPAIMHLYKASLHVRSKKYRRAMHEVEAALAEMPEAIRAGDTYYLRKLVKYAYAQEGEVLIQMHDSGNVLIAVAQKHEPASAIVVTGNRDQNIPAIMHLYKASLHVRSKKYRRAMHEVEAALAEMPEAIRAGDTYYLRKLVKYAYAQEGEVLIPKAAPKVIELNPQHPVYEEDFSTAKRVEDAFDLDSAASEWGKEILKPYGYDEKAQQHYISRELTLWNLRRQLLERQNGVFIFTQVLQDVTLEQKGLVVVWVRLLSEAELS